MNSKNIASKIGPISGKGQKKSRKNKMLKNLLKTWEILAPDEVRCDEWGGVWMRDRYSASFCIELSNDGFLLPYEEFLLQGYIQQCIEARKWEYEIYGNSINRAFKNFCVVSTGHYSAGQTNKGVLRNLLAVYLTVLAAQRPITPGKWQHFKGGIMEVVGEASPVDSISKSVGVYQLEEVPEQTVYLSNDGFFSTAYWDYMNRVFYRHDSMNWARKTEDFLGLVGPEHPEHEGLLRFVEAGNNATTDAI